MQLARALHRLTVHIDHHVGRGEIAARRGSVRKNFPHHHTLIDAEHFLQRRLVAQRLDTNTEPRTHHAPLRDERLAHLPCEIGRNGEAQTATQPVDQRVHADHFSVEIDERTSAVARIDRRIGLQIVLVNRAGQIAPPFRADHSHRQRVIQFERRADAADEFAHPRFLAVAPRHRRKSARLRFQHRQISLLVDAHHFERKLRAVLPPRHHAFLRIGALDDVRVGQNVTVRTDDKPRAFTFVAARALRTGCAAEERFPGDIVIAAVRFGHLQHDNTGRHPLVDPGKRITQRPCRRRRRRGGGRPTHDGQKNEGNPFHAPHPTTDAARGQRTPRLSLEFAGDPPDTA